MKNMEHQLSIENVFESVKCYLYNYSDELISEVSHILGSAFMRLAFVQVQNASTLYGIVPDVS